jgi:ribosomal protein S18 acetylase RimI-like enzyme
LIEVGQFPPLGVSLEALAARAGTFFGISLEGCLIAAIEIEELDPATRLIAALVIDPAYARRGLGRRLVGFVLDGSPARVRVSTSAANVPALALYRSAGFREIATSRSPDGIALRSLEWRRQE